MPAATDVTVYGGWTDEEGRTLELERDAGGVWLVVSGDWMLSWDRRRAQIPTRRFLLLGELAEALVRALLSEVEGRFLSDPSRPSQQSDQVRRLTLIRAGSRLIREALERDEPDPDDEPF